MKLLLDECVPWPLHQALPAYQCQTAQQCGWGGFKNGDLLRQAEGHFDVFVTADKNLRYQQNLAGRTLPIVELSTNNLRRLIASREQIENALQNLSSGDYRQVIIT